MGYALLMIISERSYLRCNLNPAVMHALAVIEECRDNIPEARKLAALQMQCCTSKEFNHWVQVYAVLNGESGGKS
jgi:hypothetical protein